MATMGIGESFEKEQQLQQQQQKCYDYDPKSGFCSRTGIYRSLFKLCRHHVIPSDHNLDVASFVLSKLPPQHISETKIALIDSTTGSSLTYSHLRRSALSLAAALHHGLSLRKGDVVFLLLSPNSILYPTICLGILASGAIITPANPLSTHAEVAEHIRYSGAKLAISAPEEAHKVLEATRIPVLTSTTTQGPHNEYTSNLLSVEELMEGGDVLDAPSESIGTTQSDVAALLYLSMSSSSEDSGTSKSKGELLTLTHGNLISMSMIVKWGVEKESSLAAAAAAAADQDDIFLCILPMSDVFGQALFFELGMPCVGSTMVLMPGRFDGRAMMEAVDKYRISNILNLAVPPPVLLSAMNSNSGGWDLSLLRRVNINVVGSGGAAAAAAAAAGMGSNVGKEFRRRFPWVAVREWYGSSGNMARALYCGPTTVFASEEDARGRIGCVGQLLPRLEGKVVEVKSRTVAGPGVAGELWLRGPTVIKGGVDDDQDAGWLRTGDVAYFDEDGFLYLVDNSIYHKGYQASTAELEAILVTHPQILEAAVTQIPDQKALAGQVPMAYVVRSSAQSTLTSEEVIQFVATQVAPYMIEKVSFVNAIPRSATGRILRKQLTAQTQQTIPAKL